jgi:DNA polymerase/3'-5' exonuclease PolX
MNSKLNQYKTIAAYYDFTGDVYRANAYRKAIKDGSTHLRLIDTSDSQFKIYLVLAKVVGAGPSTIRKWIKDKIYTIADLRSRIQDGYKVTMMQFYGVKYYNDFQKPIPRSTAEKIGNSIIKYLGNGIIVGSYRRGATSLKDIDILTLSDKTLVLSDKQLGKQLPIHIVTNGQQKQTIIYMHQQRAHRVDILRTTTLESPTALFYFTGSKDFNKRVRSLAKQQGYTLSEHGLFDARGKRIPLASERDIFDKLKISYLTPSKRI